MNAALNAKAKIKLIECPRDAMQGWPHFIPTQKKIDYINTLLKVGFDTIDFGSFVSPKAIPQMADTKEVIGNLELGGSNFIIYHRISCPTFVCNYRQQF